MVEPHMQLLLKHVPHHCASACLPFVRARRCQPWHWTRDCGRTPPPGV